MLAGSVNVVPYTVDIVGEMLRCVLGNLGSVDTWNTREIAAFDAVLYRILCVLISSQLADFIHSANEIVIYARKSALELGPKSLIGRLFTESAG